MNLRQRKKASDKDEFITTPLPPHYCDSRTSAFKVLFQAQNTETAKILGFTTLAMVVIPVATFYSTMNTIFSKTAQPTTWAGLAAVFAVNVVLVAYIIFAFSEKDPEKEGNGSGDDYYAGDKGNPRTEGRLRTD
mmetsp:Transcript_28040/g.64192  ORF Transcript_28040/g.64192 Transcript_28040/m.64192 type:complete len:134 (-) Transcript_28040:88-489(-)